VSLARVVVTNPELQAERESSAHRRLDLLVNSEDRDLLKVQTVVIASPEPAMRCFVCPGSDASVRTAVAGYHESLAIASRIGLQTTWGKMSFGLGALVLWATRLRRVNGPNFTWPLVQFPASFPNDGLARTCAIYKGASLSPAKP